VKPGQGCRVFDSVGLLKQQTFSTVGVEKKTWLGSVHIQLVFLDSLNQRRSLHAQKFCAAGDVAIRLPQGPLDEILFNIAEHAL